MNNPVSLQLFKAEIKKVTLILQENHEKLPSSWITATKNILLGLDSHSFNINSLLSELEDLAILLLLRSTTRLESICSIEIQSVANEIFQRIKPLKFSRAISSGIEEFLAVSRPPLPEAPLNKEIDQLNQQIRSLQEKLNQSSTRPSLELMTLESPQCSPELLSSQAALDREVKRVSDQGHDSKNEEKKSSGTMEVEKEIKEIGVEKPTPLQEMIDILDSDRKIHSFCILDIEGNFVMADKRAETLFETKHEDLLRSNLFDLMIPYSKFYLEKTLGDSIFSSLDSQPKTFSYTVYSAHALKRYQKEITRMTRKDYAERKKVNEQKFSLDEKKLVTKDNSIYYKYLQTLTSRATLIELKFSKLEDVLKLENTHDVKVKLEHEIFQGPSETQRVVSQPAVLLITRKAYHIQKFRYSLMEEWDDKIIKMEEKVERNLSKNSIKLARKEENFRVKVEMNSYFESDSAMASEDIFQDEDFPSP